MGAAERPSARSGCNRGIALGRVDRLSQDEGLTFMHLGIHILYYIILLVVLFLGLAINVLGLPGLWLMVSAHAVYALVTGWNGYVCWPSLIAMIVLALIAE